MPKSLPEVDKSKLFMVVPSIYLNTNQNTTCVGPFWGSRTSVDADVDGRVVAARLHQQQQVHGSYHDPRAPPDCFPGSVGCRHEDRGPDTPSCLSSCLPIRCSPNPPICSFSATMSLLLHFSVAAAGKTPPLKCIQMQNPPWQLDAKYHWILITSQKMYLIGVINILE